MSDVPPPCNGGSGLKAALSKLKAKAHQLIQTKHFQQALPGNKSTKDPYKRASEYSITFDSRISAVGAKLKCQH